jgi:putative transposase
VAKVVKRVYRYRFYPSPGQAAELSRTFGCVRLVWNKALDARTSAWYERQERVTYVQSSAMLTQWKSGEDLAFLGEVSCVPVQQALAGLAVSACGGTVRPDSRKRERRVPAKQETLAARPGIPVL